MKILKSLPLGMARYMAHELNLDSKSTDAVRFGLELILGAILKGVVILGFSYWLEITPYVLTAMATSGIFRSVSGGAHCNTFLGCLIFSSTTLIAIGYLAKLLSPFISNEILLICLLISLLTGLFSVIKWAPVDHPNKPIKRDKKRKKFKVLSVIYIIFWGLIILFLISLENRMPMIFSYVLASLGGFIASLLSIFPASHLIFNVFDKFLNRCF